MRPSFDWHARWPQVNCFYPVYGGDGGNYTRILLHGGEEVVYPKRTDTTLRELCREFGVDPQARRRKYGALVRRSFSAPIPVRPGLTLIPVRVRTGVDKGQGTVGYAVLARVKDCLPAPSSTEARGLLVFEDGSELATQHTARTLADFCRTAREVEQAFLAREGGFAGGRPGLDAALFLGREPEEIFVVARYRVGAAPADGPGGKALP